eukprot:s85_g25.t1
MLVDVAFDITFSVDTVRALKWLSETPPKQCMAVRCKIFFTAEAGSRNRQLAPRSQPRVSGLQVTFARVLKSRAMDDDLERAARKHRLQQRHGAIRAQQRQRLQEEQKKAALDVSPANADALPSSSSRPANPAEQAQVPEKAVCAIRFHVRLVSLLLEKLDLPYAQLQELRVSCRRGCKVHASINEGEAGVSCAEVLKIKILLA